MGQVSGVKHYKVRLSDQDVEKMRSLRENDPDTWTYKMLADHIQCGASTARDVVCYRTRYSGGIVPADRYDKQYEMRVAIIGYSKQLKGAGFTVNDLADAIRAKPEHCYNCLKAMAGDGEVEKTGVHINVRYRVLVDVPLPAAVVRARSHDRREQAMLAKIKTEPKGIVKGEPWRYIHRVTEHDKPIPNQGGQGNVRQTVYVSATCGII